MKLYKPKFWNKKNFLSILLFPISLIVQLFAFIKQKSVKSLNFNIPIICLGNIYLGGTGKTPLSIYLANELKKRGKNPVIIRKYYKSHKDEHSLIKKKIGFLILNTNRANAIKEAERKGFDSVILDDGFQDHKIKKDLNVICFNSFQLDGNGLVLPAGPLRESFDSLKRAHIVMINGEKNNSFEERIYKINKNIKIFYSKYDPINVQQFRQGKFIALIGIGNPENFLSLLSKIGVNIIKKYIVPDHYQFDKNEVSKIIQEAKDNDCKIILTEKDYYKVKDFSLERMVCLKVDLSIDEKENFLDAILKTYD